MRARGCLVYLLLVFGLSACTLQLPGKAAVSETPDITSEAQVTEVPMTPTPPITELKIEDLYGGTGPEAKGGDTVSVHYTGTFLDGTKFDSSLDRKTPFEFRLGAGEVISGWDIGIKGMRVGGKRRLTIPPQFAYGDRGAGNVIPPNTTLMFEVDLLAINPPKETRF